MPHANNHRLIRDDLDERVVRYLEAQSFDLSDGEALHSLSTDVLIRLCQAVARNEGVTEPVSRESAEQIAERVLDNHRIRPDWRRTGEQIVPLLAEAVRIARGEES
ncbi:hypothetical protein SEA_STRAWBERRYJAMM_108 [Microbacterium phage StrawberryJamm]|nr:hypothetical protein SEA_STRAWBERRYJAMM_108 [Microbacterium phage StrawberryJamm]